MVRFHHKAPVGWDGWVVKSNGLQNRKTIGSNPILTSKGNVAEWFKAAVLKTVESKGSVSSNPTISARIKWNIGRVGLRHFPAKKASGQKPDRWFESNMFRQLSLQ